MNQSKSCSKVTTAGIPLCFAADFVAWFITGRRYHMFRNQPTMRNEFAPKGDAYNAIQRLRGFISDD
jgi:hypothetical protein